MATFFTSDLHFSHAAVIQYSKRPFASVEEMNEKLIENWNSRVKPKDPVFVIGDLIFGKLADQDAILTRLNGNIQLIHGNHDSGLAKRLKQGRVLAKITSLGHYYEFKDNHEKFVLCHFPFEAWNLSSHGGFHLHGHSHGAFEKRSIQRNIRRLDVGVDVHNYFPISLEEVRQILTPRGHFVDHHQEDQ